MHNTFGPITLFGSGETLPASGAAYEFTAAYLKASPEIAILETPAGFQPNTEIVARKVAEFIETRLQNYHPTTRIIPARISEGKYSTNNEAILEPLVSSNWIFIGPGSPTYAVKHIRDSLLLNYLYASQATGCALTFSSAAVLAMSSLTLPVYEIYKVGDDLHWTSGLNFFKAFGIECIFIPHWNNNSGGEELDTSRCFMGVDRFQQLKAMLPQKLPIIGIDEQTALTFVFGNKPMWKVTGIGTITIDNEGSSATISEGEFDPETLGFSTMRPEAYPPDIQSLITKIDANKLKRREVQPPDDVLHLAQQRASARNEKDWKTADLLRTQIENLGWEIVDDENGHHLNQKKA